MGQDGILGQSHSEEEMPNQQARPSRYGSDLLAYPVLWWKRRAKEPA